MKKQIKTTARIFVKAMLLTLMSQPVCAQSNLDLPQMKHEYDPLVFEHFEQMASFPGGDRELINFIAGNLRCPKEIKKARLRGRVDVLLTIAKNGAVEDVSVENSTLKNKRGLKNYGNAELRELCIKEAVRVIKMMPKWIPANSYGARFGVQFRLSIFFNEPQEYDIFFVKEIWDKEALENYIHNLPPNYAWNNSEEYTAATDLMKMKYCKPEGFCQVDSAETFMDYMDLRNIIMNTSVSLRSGVGPFLRSDDGQFISFLQFVPVFSKRYVERMSRSGCFNGHFYFREHQDRPSLYTLAELLENYHHREMKDKIQWNNRCYDNYSWRNSVSVFNTTEAREKFNADSAFTFTLHLSPEYYYEKNFKHLKVLLIQRKGRGYACIYSFYTDKAQEHFDKYWRRIEGTLMFRE